MNRDPSGYDCTRDPIYLLQVARRQWTQIPNGLECDGESWIVADSTELDDWIKPFIEWCDDDPTSGVLVDSEEMYAEAERQLNDNDWPMVYTEWLTELVFLTRAEAESWATARNYRWQKWRVYCVCCEGELARVLNDIEVTAAESP